ncbi:YbhB/YbcL family Raf kinase inhibitor-like protein [Colidextribacter sp. OB.20]|uniref:YbhB/YbcL family Raf kinase inhibitor-like protein n=1 Tax=Colidextribacter sp. OB.20 TaxID=2304568 RepID=UPI001370BC0A|nr:YbhB/YbcL family Raf kinase inhibitor-like protein [Colidextribacter sp. OB.20]NBI10330.1 YbhB/YbcL family Raf kinase inhibitor-like protein [Colidextribacter sp. OB.20]
MEEKMLKIHCSGIENGKFLPDHTGRGRDLSPELILENLSPEAVTLAVVLEDMSHPIKGFTHWVIWNLPAADRVPGAIPAGKSAPGGAAQGVAYGLHRYAGPKPPKGRTHTYRFTVYALNCALDLSPASRKKTFLRAAEGHILQRGSISGAFE